MLDIIIALSTDPTPVLLLEFLKAFLFQVRKGRRTPDVLIQLVTDGAPFAETMRRGSLPQEAIFLTMFPFGTVLAVRFAECVDKRGPTT